MGPHAKQFTLAPPHQADVAAAAVTELYQASALGMVRLAHVLTGDRSAAEDIVQDAFSGLYRRWAYLWEHLCDPDKALSHVRSAVLNACRSSLRRRRVELTAVCLVDVAAADEAVLTQDERRTVMAALHKHHAYLTPTAPSWCPPSSPSLAMAQ